MKYIMKLLGIHVHSWGMWEIESSGNVLHAGTTRVAGKYLFQQRRCSTCGKIQLNSQTVY